MSRALNLQATVEEVSRACAAIGVATTSLEGLLPTGSRVVCQTSEGAVALRGKFKGRLLDGEVTREPRSLRGRY